MAATQTISGVISGMDTSGIIDKLMEIEKAPLTRLQDKKTALENQLSAWKDANTRIGAVKDAAEKLAKSSTFDAKLIESSDEDILKASVSSTAQTGTYYIKINQLARANQIKSSGFASTSDKVGTGTFSITLANGAPTIITIDDSNNSLTGLKDAINNADAGVKASIINDGSAGSPYRLVITSETSGTAGAMTIDSNLTNAGTSTFSTMQAAQDASLTLGEGAGGITVTKGSNKITDLIPGVTLNLVTTTDTDETVTVNVKNDTSGIIGDITNFIDQYNNLIDYMSEQSDYDASTGKAGTLFADSTLSGIESTLSDKLFAQVSGLKQQIAVLSQLGVVNITGDESGKLELDEDTLNDVIDDYGLDAVKRVFSTMGDASNSSVSFVSATADTKSSSIDGYAIEVTAVAAKARATMGVTQTAALDQDEEITLNDKTITFTKGMTAAQVVAEINEHTADTGVVASRTDINGEGTGDYLTLTRVGYGSSGTITVKSNTSSLGGTSTSGIGTTEITQSNAAGEAGTGTGTVGADVQGTINGEAATGRGQKLTGNDGNEYTAGLCIKITGQTVGSYGTISLTKGISSTLYDYLDYVTNSNGTIKTLNNSIQQNIDSLDDEITDMNDKLDAKREYYLLKFTAMESSLSNIKNQGSYLSSMLS
ncbi:MAG: flagellar filament capping protein FliD [Armatimonadota bacterium]